LAYFSTSTSALIGCGGKVARLGPAGSAAWAGVLRVRVGAVWLMADFRGQAPDAARIGLPKP